MQILLLGTLEGFPGGSVVKVGTFAAVAWVQFLVRELRILQTVQDSHKKKKDTGTPNLKQYFLRQETPKIIQTILEKLA